MNKTESTSEPTIYNTSNNNEEMNNAIDLARKHEPGGNSVRFLVSDQDLLYAST